MRMGYYPPDIMYSTMKLLVKTSRPNCSEKINEPNGYLKQVPVNFFQHKIKLYRCCRSIAGVGIEPGSMGKMANYGQYAGSLLIMEETLLPRENSSDSEVIVLVWRK